VTRLAVMLVLALAVSGCDGVGGETTTATGSAATASIPATTNASTQSLTTTTAPTAAQPEEGSGSPGVKDAVSAVLTVHGDPAQACGTFVTETFIETAYGGRRNCLAAQRPSALAESFEVVSLSPRAGAVHLVVVPDGGAYDGSRVEVDVVVGDHGGYLVDSLQAHVPAGP
jgi:hypothetical protein